VKLPLKVLKGDFPANTRYVGNNKYHKIVIVEAEPAKRMVFINGRTICLYFPYTYFIIQYVESMQSRGKTGYVLTAFHIGFSPNKITHTNGLVYELPLSNYHGAFSFCLGDSRPKNPYSSVRELANALMNAFWQTEFHNLYAGNAWIEATKKNTGLRYTANNFDIYRGGEAIGFLVHINEKTPFFNYHPETAPTQPVSKPKFKKPKIKRPPPDHPSRKKKKR
jgi:hypothetical protein